MVGPEAGDATFPASFEGFYRTRATELHRMARELVGPEAADDACQEAWLRMWCSWETADRAHLDAWARRVVRACCALGRCRVRSTVDLGDVRAAGAEPEELAVVRGELEAVVRLIGRLPRPMGETLWCRVVAGLSYAEIAATLRIPVGTVMSRLHTARRRLERRRTR